MAKREIPTPDELRQLLRYEPETGKLFWRYCSVYLFEPSKFHSAKRVCQMWNAKYAGKQAITASDRRYLIGKVRGRMLKAHRIAWAIFYGNWPEGQIDHINGNTVDNRIQNLRDVSSCENSRNRSRKTLSRYSARRRKQDAECFGVSWDDRKSRWSARIGHANGEIYLGMYRTKFEAIAARKAAERVLGYHRNHGRAYEKQKPSTETPRPQGYQTWT